MMRKFDFPKIGLFFWICLFLSINLLAQETAKEDTPEKNTIDATIFRLSYGLQLPVADMSKRFGVNSTLEGSIGYKNHNNWLYTFEIQFLFGNQVKNSLVAQNLLTSDGTILGLDGMPAPVTLLERGWNVGIQIGKIINLNAKNPNSGLLISAGGGMLWHKIQIENQMNNTPQLEGDYAKGYDRLTSGFSLKEFIGYIHLGNRRRVNFLIGLEIIQGFTENKRVVFFDTQMADLNPRLDMLIGIKAAWMLPLYGKVKNAKKYYIN